MPIDPTLPAWFLVTPAGRCMILWTATQPIPKKHEEQYVAHPITNEYAGNGLSALIKDYQAGKLQIDESRKGK